MVLTQPGDHHEPTVNRNPVSIPLWFLRNTIPEEICPWIYNVSIPLWFLRNPTIDVHTETGALEFPYHYGSYATHKYVIGQKVCPEAFPYHYGSYATKSGFDFDKLKKSSFHTTMVLTQHSLQTNLRKSMTSFHTTMVLTQRLSRQP